MTKLSTSRTCCCCIELEAGLKIITVIMIIRILGFLKILADGAEFGFWPLIIPPIIGILTYSYAVPIFLMW